MSPDPQDWNQENQTVGGVPSGQFYVRAVRTDMGADIPGNENIGGIPSGQFYGTAGTNTATAPKEENAASKPQSDNQPASKGRNNALTKALVGGLVGATLGTLAAALANRRTAEGANHAAKGVGKAVKSVSEGVNHAAKGVGDAVKTVSEGVNHAVVGSVVDALKDTAEGAKKSVESTAEELKQTADYANRSDYANRADYVNRADQQFDAQTTYVLIPVEKERVIERTIIVEPTMPIDSGETGFMSEDVEGQMLNNNEQASEFNQQTSQSNEQTPDFPQ